jgi:hypothetical protein
LVAPVNQCVSLEVSKHCFIKPLPNCFRMLQKTAGLCVIDASSLRVLNNVGFCYFHLV